MYKPTDKIKGLIDLSYRFAKKEIDAQTFYVVFLQEMEIVASASDGDLALEQLAMQMVK